MNESHRTFYLFVQSAPKNPARRLSSAVDLVIVAAHGVRGGVAEVSREWRMIMETRGALIRQPRRWIHHARRVKAADGSPDSHAPTAFYLLLLFAAVAYSSFPFRETCMIGWPDWRLISNPAFVGTKRAAPPTSSSFFPPRLLSLRAQEKREWVGEKEREGGGWRGSSVTTRGAAIAGVRVRAGLLYYLDRPASFCFTFDILSPFFALLSIKKKSGINSETLRHTSGHITVLNSESVTFKCYFTAAPAAERCVHDLLTAVEP